MSQIIGNGPPQVQIKDESGKVIFDGSLVDQEFVNAFFATMGWSISLWSQIDRKHFEICHSLLGADETKAAISYYRLSSLSERLGYTDELIAVTEIGGLWDNWKELQAEIRAEIPLRNILAHQPLVNNSTIRNLLRPDGSPSVQIKHAMFVEIEQKELLRGARKPRQLELGELIEHGKRVYIINDKLTIFLSSLRLIQESTLRSSRPRIQSQTDRYKKDRPYRVGIRKLLLVLHRVRLKRTPE